MPKALDPFQRVVNDPTSLARIFFSVSDSIESVYLCAIQVRNKLDEHRKSRSANDETDLRQDSNLCEWVCSLQTALSTVDANKIEHECFSVLRKATRKIESTIPGSDCDGIIDVLEDFEYSIEALTSYWDDLAVRAFGQWGAYFFFYGREDAEKSIRNELDDKGIEFDYEALANIDLLTSASVSVTNPFVPTALQKAILRALDGRALKKMQLAAEVCGCEDNGNILYRPGGISELRNLGLVDLKRGIGFYRPDSPPPEAIFQK